MRATPIYVDLHRHQLEGFDLVFGIRDCCSWRLDRTGAVNVALARLGLQDHGSES
jgi:hypothetical protein